MKILVVTQYFWPENFRINDLVVSLKNEGHEVTVLTGKPNYPDGDVFQEYIDEPNNYSNLSGVDVFRVPMRPRKKGSVNLFLNYVSFAFSATFNGSRLLKNQSYDVIFACQLSPVTSVLPAIFIKKQKKIPLVLWSLDLWPESLQAVGIVKSQRVIHWVRKLVRYIYAQCDLILAQSEEYIDAIKKTDLSNTPTMIFPNFAEDIFGEIQVKENDSSQINVLFAGNIGDAQDFDAVVECSKLVKQNKLNVQIQVVGDGRKRHELEQNIVKYELQDHLIYHGKFPLEDMPRFYSQADAALVSLKTNDIFSRTIPGKVQSYMMASLPIIGMIDGSTAALIAKANCGYCCKSGDFHSLYENLEKFSLLNEKERINLGCNGYQYASEYFNKDSLVSKLSDALEEISKKGL